jgi:uncharacterized protein GlcG (DUF336 family)
MNNTTSLTSLIAGTALIASANALADPQSECSALPDHAQLKDALDQAVAQPSTPTGGFGLDMWATLVNRDGVVCAVAFSGADRGSQWPGSRVISAQKANTANAFSLDTANVFSLDGLALSTANLFSAVQPGGSLFGLQHSNPVDTGVAYKGPSRNYGQPNDPMVGEKIGGVNVFGGGLGLYDAQGNLVGGLGLSGDTSCADHMKAWLVRANLALDNLSGVGGVSGDGARPDNIVYDIDANPNGGTGISAGGFGHAGCFNTTDQTALPAVQ